MHSLERQSRHLPLVIWAVLALVASACAPAPSAAPTTAPAAAKPTTAPVAPAAAAPTAAPAAAAPTAVPAAKPVTGAATGAPIKIGAILDITGGFADFSRLVLRGYEMAVADANANGGVKGAQVELQVEDTGSQGDQATILARKLAAQQDVLAIAGPLSSGWFVSTSQVAAEAGLLNMSPTSAANWQGEFPSGAFRINSLYTKILPEFMKQMKEQKKLTSVAILFDQNNESNVSEKNDLEKVIPNLGMKLGGVEAFRTKDSDFSGQVTKLLATNPDGIYLGSLLNEGGLIIQQLRERGYKGVLMGGSGLSDPRIYDLSGKTADGLVTYFPFNSQDKRSKAAAFIERYKAQYNEDVPGHAALGYDTITAMVEAMRRASSPLDRKAVVTAFGSISELEGLTGKMGWNGKGDNLFVNFTPYEMQGGKFKPLAS